MLEQETKFNTSFIPKKNVASSYSKTGIPKKGPSLLSIIGMFFFIVAILGVAGAYSWRYRVDAQIRSQIEELQKARAQFDDRTIAEATRLNKKINSVMLLLENHVAATIIFQILEEKTMRNVSYRTFSYETASDGKILVNGSGLALNLEAVVLQSDELGRSDFRDVLFDNIQNVENDNVSFSLEASIDKNVILFSNKRDNALEFLQNNNNTN